METKRASGRTTRMLTEAIGLARQGGTVFVIAADERHVQNLVAHGWAIVPRTCEGGDAREWSINRTSDTFRYGPAPNAFVQFGTPERLGFHWDLMRATVYGPGAIFLVDHHTIESRWAGVLEMLHRWDAAGPTQSPGTNSAMTTSESPLPSTTVEEA